jgi:prolyl oligopeptidase
MEAGPQDPRFLTFLKAQNEFTRATLASLSGREQLLARIRELDNAAPAVRLWQRGGTSIFYLETAPGAKTASLMVRGTDGKSRKLVDPASLEQGNSHAAIDYFAPSWDGRYVIAGVSLGGSENSTIHVIESATGRMLPDAITRTQYANPVWQTDSRSFYYARLQQLPANAPPSAVYENERVYLHVLGRDVEKDAAVFGPGVASSVDVPRAGFVGAGVTPGSEYAIAFYSAGTTGAPSLYVAPASSVKNAGTPWRRIVSAEDMVSTTADNPVAQHASTLYLLLDKDSPNNKLVSLYLDHSDMAHAKILVPEGESLLTGIYAASDGLYLSSRRGVVFELQRSDYGPQLKWQKITLPYNGSTSNIDANVLLPGIVFRLESWTRSDQAFAYTPPDNRVNNTNLVQRNPADFTSIDAREVEVTSADGTKVPLSILCKKGLTLDGSHPTLYEGYGSYGISIDPYFDPRTLAWLERGGVFAIVHVRGGGEFGEAWHNAGRKQTKQHTIDDMVAAAQYLNQQHYSSPEHLAVMGTSAGGIAVGGAIVQHP